MAVYILRVAYQLMVVAKVIPGEIVNVIIFWIMPIIVGMEETVLILLIQDVTVKIAVMIPLVFQQYQRYH